MSIEENDLQDDVRAAFEAAAEPEPELDSSGRDEKGRFVAKEGQTEVEAAAQLQPQDKAAVPTEPQSQWQQDKAPQSWSAPAREKWGALPEDIRKEIVRREEAAVAGVRQLHERFAPAEQFIRNIDPFIKEAASLGMAPQDYIGAVMSSESILRNASLPDKFNEIMRIADQYGVPLREIVNRSVGQEVLKAPAQAQVAQLPPEYLQRMNSMEQYIQNIEAQSVKGEITSFSTGKPHFEQVRGVMADLVETGICDTLDQAYDHACWLNPEIRSQLIQGSPQSATASRQAAAASASIPTKGKVSVDLGDEDTDDVAAVVRAAYNRAATGRI